MNENTKKLNYYADKLDRIKWNINKEGCSFHLTVLEKDGTHRNVAIGSGEDMSVMILIQLRDLFDLAAKQGVTAEDFADSVKESFLRYIKKYPHAEEGQAFSIRFKEGDGCC